MKHLVLFIAIFLTMLGTSMTSFAVSEENPYIPTEPTEPPEPPHICDFSSSTSCALTYNNQKEIHLFSEPTIEELKRFIKTAPDITIVCTTVSSCSCGKFHKSSHSHDEVSSTNIDVLASNDELGLFFTNDQRMFEFEVSCPCSSHDFSKTLDVKVRKPFLSSGANRVFDVILGGRIYFENNNELSIVWRNLHEDIFLRITNTNGDIIKELSLSTSWDGKNTNGELVAPGEYRLVLFQKDENGNAVYEHIIPFWLVRLGIREIDFTGNYPLAFQWRNSSDGDDGISVTSERVALTNYPEWKQTPLYIGMTYPDNQPMVDYSQSVSSILYPAAYPLMLPYNLPVCYKVSSALTGTIKLAFNNGGSTTCPVIKLNVNWNNEPLTLNNAAMSPDANITFTSDNKKLLDYVGYQKENFKFSWSYEDNGSIIEIPGEFASNHLIYRIINAPKEPWISNAPWVSAMHFATTWAEGAKSIDEVADKITRKINSGLGLVYDIPKGACKYTDLVPQYDIAHNIVGADYTLELSKFIDFIITLNSNNLVNCSDCASLVVCFSNMLGGDLKIKHISKVHALNPIRPIGRAISNAPSSFSYHAFASTPNDYIYDACLEVPNSVNNPMFWTLPIKMQHMSNSLAVRGTPAFTSKEGSTAQNPAINIAKLWQETDHNGLITDQLVFTYSSKGGGIFNIQSVAMQLDESSDIQSSRHVISKNSIKLITVQVSKTDGFFVDGDKFTVSIMYPMNDYRSRYAAPDWKRSTIKGRTPASTLHTMVFKNIN